MKKTMKALVTVAVMLAFMMTGLGTDKVHAYEEETVNMVVNIQLFGKDFKDIPEFTLDLYKDGTLFIGKHILFEDIDTSRSLARYTFKGLPKRDVTGRAFDYEVKLSKEVKDYKATMTRYRDYRYGLQLTYEPEDEIVDYVGEYDGLPHSITHNDIPNDVLSVHYRYYKEGDSKPVGDAGWNATMPTFTEAGTYIVEAKVNYFGGTTVIKEGFVKITDKIETETHEEYQVIPFETVYIDDDTLEEEIEVVDVVGVVGEITKTIQITTTNGVQTDRKVLKTERTTEPIDEVIRRGTKVPPVITTKEIEEEEEILFDTIYVNDDTLEKGKEVVKTEGVKGKIVTTVEVTYTDGVETGRKVILKVITNEVDKVILIGTKVEEVVPPVEEKPEEKPVDKEEEKPVVEEKPVDEKPTEEVKEEKPVVEETKVPKTGIENQELMYATIIALAGVVLLVLRKRYAKA